VLAETDAADGLPIALGAPQNPLERTPQWLDVALPAPGDLVPEQKQSLERLVTKTLGPNRPPITVRVASRTSSWEALPSVWCGMPPSPC
jgi:hypothetical protein